MNNKIIYKGQIFLKSYILSWLQVPDVCSRKKLKFENHSEILLIKMIWGKKNEIKTFILAVISFAKNQKICEVKEKKGYKTKEKNNKIKMSGQKSGKKCNIERIKEKEKKEGKRKWKIVKERGK